MPFCVNHPYKEGDFQDLRHKGAWYCADCVGPVLDYRTKHPPLSARLEHFLPIVVMTIGIPGWLWLFGAETLAIQWVEATVAFWLIFSALFVVLWTKTKRAGLSNNTTSERTP